MLDAFSIKTKCHIYRKTLPFFCRYNVGAWLGLKSRADHVLHPQHEVLCELAKWLLPVLCRAPNQTLADFPRHLLLTKVE